MLRVKTLMAVSVAANVALGWLLAGLFAGGLPTAIVLALSAAGAGLAALTCRTGRGIVPLVVPLLPLGLVWLSASRQPSDGSLLGGVGRALTSGQLGDPPVPFTPAWQLLVAVVVVLVGVASVALALAANSYRAALVVPLPFMALATFMQPSGRELTGVGGALLLLMLALSLASGAQTALETGQSGELDVGRLIRSAALVGVVALVIAGLSWSGVGLTTNTAEAPRPASAPLSGRDLGEAALFEVRSAQPVALRTGVLRTYDGSEWLTPGYRPDALLAPRDGAISRQPLGSRGVGTVSVRVLSSQVGRFIPLPPGTFDVEGINDDATWDPNAESLRLAVSADTSLSYRARYGLREQADLTRIELARSATNQPAPDEVASAINAVKSDSPYAQLTALRRTLYDRASVREGGAPVPISPQRAVRIWQGAPATGFELAATEALLARWVGLDARLGYGYLRLVPESDGSYLVHGTDAAIWVEVGTAEGSWVPLLDRPRTGAPPIAPRVQIVPNGAKVAQLEIPLHRPDPSMLSKSVKYWLVVYTAIGAGLLTMWVAFPSILRLRRTLQRQRWARDSGARGRVLVAYAALRDKAIDLDVGTREASVLDFLELLTPDEDHVEFAWLVNRTLYGDLRRNTTDADADLAEAFSASLVRRLAQGQSYLHRLVRLGSHRSLREPWTRDGALPTGYPRWLAALTPTGWSRRRRWLMAALAGLTLLAIPAATGVQRIPVHDLAAPTLPSVPARVLDLGFKPVPGATEALAGKRGEALIGDAQLYLVTQGSGAVGTLQTSAFKSSLEAINLDVRRGVLDALGMTDVSRVGNQIFFTRALGDVRQVLWFSADGRRFQLLTTDRSIQDPSEVLARLVAAQSGADPARIADIKTVQPRDIRQGSISSDTKPGSFNDVTRLPPPEEATP